MTVALNTTSKRLTVWVQLHFADMFPGYYLTGSYVQYGSDIGEMFIRRGWSCEQCAGNRLMLMELKNRQNRINNYIAWLVRG